MYEEKERNLVEKKKRTQELLKNEKNRLLGCIDEFERRREAY